MNKAKTDAIAAEWNKALLVDKRVAQESLEIRIVLAILKGFGVSASNANKLIYNNKGDGPIMQWFNAASQFPMVVESIKFGSRASMLSEVRKLFDMSGGPEKSYLLNSILDLQDAHPNTHVAVVTRLSDCGYDVVIHTDRVVGDKNNQAAIVRTYEDKRYTVQSFNHWLKDVKNEYVWHPNDVFNLR